MAAAPAISTTGLVHQARVVAYRNGRTTAYAACDARVRVFTLGDHSTPITCRRCRRSAS